MTNNKLTGKNIFILLLFVFVFVSTYLIGRSDGIKTGKNLVTINDFCDEFTKNGFGGSAKSGHDYYIFECKKYIGDFMSSWTFEGDWDKCDEQGENCEPYARNSEKVSNTKN